MNNKQDIVIFGYAAIGKSLADYLSKSETLRVVSFCDNSALKNKHGNTDIKVLSVPEAIRQYPHAMFYTASLYHSKQMKEQLILLGIADRQIITELPTEIVQAERAAERQQRLLKHEKLRFEVNINKHCNLNCKGCDHFAPLSSEDCMDLGIYERDMRRMGDLFHGEAWQVHLLGGEPLLNPNLESYARIARECFPHSEIWIDTNGTLLKRMPDSFWSACKKFKLGIMPTKYPVAVDYDELQRITEAYGVPYQYLGSSESGRMLWHFPLDLTGSQDMKDSFLNCRNANECLTLENGRLYTCSIAPNIKVFNEYFKQHIELTEDDGIDISSAKTGDEVLEAMARPMTFCRYCDVKHRTYDHPWEVSRKEIAEWT